MSHRLEEIVAQLMRPIHNLKQNFDIDLSLLEEYLTEMGVQRLSGAPEDFATIAMLVQQCAHIYGKKVDFYEQSVYDMVEKSAVTNREHNEEDNPTVEAEAKSSRKRKRRHSGAFRDFGPIDLEPAPNIDRETESVRQPPTLPKTYVEFERPPLTERDARLRDYQGCEIGVAADFHVNWNVHEGAIVDHLDSSAAINQDMVVPIVVAVLDEMRRLSPPISGSDSGIEQADPPFHLDSLCLPDPPKERKRKQRQEQATPAVYKKAKSVKHKRVRAIWEKVRRMESDGCFLSAVELREMECGNVFHEGLLARGLRKLCVDCSIERFSFKGFSNEDILADRLGLTGFSTSEVREAGERSRLQRACVSEPPPALTDSDDDGFFDMSDSHDTSVASTAQPVERPSDSSALTGRVEAWHALVAPRVAEAEARDTFDIHDYSRRILARLPPAKRAPFASVARQAEPHEICRYFLATLFLANTGNVDIVKTGSALSAEGFDIRLLSSDKTLFASSNPFE